MIEIQTIINYIAIISVPVGVVYHILTLNNTRKNQNMQLETRQAQLFTQWYLKFQENISAYMDIVTNWHYDNLDDFYSKYGRESENPQLYSDWYELLSFLEGLGVLVKRNLTSKHIVADFMSGFIVRYWDKFQPLIMEQRERHKWSSGYEMVEFLYNEIEPIYRNKSET